MNNSTFLKALANDTRIKIVQTLENGNNLNVTQITNIIKSSQSSISQHLAILKDAGILKTRRDAQTIFYSIKDSRASNILKLLNKGAENCSY